MRILVVGAGATGGYFGGRLAASGRHVTFLVRAKRAEQLRAGGLQIKSPHGDLSVVPQVVTADGIAGPFDAVLLAVKAYALEGALADMAPAVGPGTVVVPLLNGMRHMDMLLERFGPEPILGGVCVVATTLDGQGRVVQLAEMQELAYGERDGSASDRITALDGGLGGAGFRARRSETILQDMWEKWMLLAALGAATCLMRGTVGDIEAVPGGAAFTLAVLAECAAVAGAAGFAPRDKFLARAQSMLTAKGSSFASSMYRDMQGNGPVEAEHIVGDLVRRGGETGVVTPLLDVALAHLRVYGARRG